MPKVSKRVLLLISGLFWMTAGFILLRIAFLRFPLLEGNEPYIVLPIGLLLGLLIAYFGFSGIAKKNILRIKDYNKEKVCIWAFQKWSSYLIIILMMSMGILMRNNPLIPAYILIPVYIGIGVALFSSSFLYYITLLKDC
jgi:hypothetical protein